VHSPRNSDWIDFANELFPNILPPGKVFKTMTGDELDNAYRAFMAIAGDRRRTDDERVVAARMAGKIAGHSRVVQRKWDEFNEEWDNELARATNATDRQNIALLRDRAAQELVNRIGVPGTITRARRNMAEAKMPRQDANPDDWYEYINNIPDSTPDVDEPVSPVRQPEQVDAEPAPAPGTPSPRRPRSETTEEATEAVDTPDRPTPSSPTPRQPRPSTTREEETESAAPAPRVERQRRGEEQTEGTTGGRGVRTGSRGRQAVIGGTVRRNAETVSIEELLDWAEEADDYSARKKEAREARPPRPFNEPEIKSPDGRIVNRRVRDELGLDSSRTITQFNDEELDDLFEKLWNIMTDPNESMKRRRLARSLARTVENANERRTRRAGRTQGSRSAFGPGRFFWGDNYRLYVVPRRRSSFDDFLKSDPDDYTARTGRLNRPIPEGWRPEDDSGYGTARYVSPYRVDPDYVSPEDPLPFSNSDDISLGTSEPSTETGAITREMIDELDATLEESGFTEKNRQKAKVDLVDHIEKIARREEEETADISDGTRDAFGIARGEAEKVELAERQLVLDQEEWFSDPPISNDGNVVPGRNVSPGLESTYSTQRADKLQELNTAYATLSRASAGGSRQEQALQDVTDMAQRSINFYKREARDSTAQSLDDALSPEQRDTARALAENYNFLALAYQHAFDEFLTSVTATLSDDTKERMADEVAQRSVWENATDRIIPEFTLPTTTNGYVNYRLQRDVQQDFLYAALQTLDFVVDDVTSPINVRSADTTSESMGNLFAERFDQPLARLRARNLPESARERLAELEESFARALATQDITLIADAINSAVLDHFGQVEEFARGIGRVSSRIGDGTEALPFAFYRVNGFGENDYFRHQARILADRIDSIIYNLNSGIPNTRTLNASQQELIDGLAMNAVRMSGPEMADTIVANSLIEQIESIREIGVLRRQPGFPGRSLAQIVAGDENAALLTDPNVTIDDLGIDPATADRIRNVAAAFSNSLHDMHNMITLGGTPNVLDGDGLSFLNDFDDEWLGLDALRSRAPLSSAQRIAGSFIPPANTGEVNITDPDQLDTQPPTDQMRERIRNLVNGVFQSRRERQAGRYQAMYPDGAPWQGDPLNNPDHPLHDTYTRAVAGDYLARQELVKAAYLMPPFEVEIIERDSFGQIVRTPSGRPKKVKYQFRVDPDTLSSNQTSASGFIQAKTPRQSRWTNIGHFSRSLDWNIGRVSHNHMYLGSDASSWVGGAGETLGDKLKGSGFSETFNGHALRTLQAANFETANVSAASDGTYVWGRSGFRRGMYRDRAATRMRSEVSDWENGRPSIVRSQDQANMWTHVARRLDEQYDEADPYDHIEAIVAIDDSASIADPDERRRRSKEIKDWFQNNAYFSSGTLNIEEVYGIPETLSTSPLSSDATLPRSYADEYIETARRDVYVGSLMPVGRLVSGNGNSAEPYYGITRYNQGPGETPQWAVPPDLEINPAIADTSTGSDHAESYVRSLANNLRSLVGDDYVPAWLDESVRLRRDRGQLARGLLLNDQQEITDAIDAVRPLVDRDTAEATMRIRMNGQWGTGIFDVINDPATPGIQSALLARIGVVDREMQSQSRPLVVRAPGRMPTLGEGEVEVVMRPTSAAVEGRPTYYVSDSPAIMDAVGILYPNQEINEFGLDWSRIRNLPRLGQEPNLAGFTRGKVEEDDVAKLRMTRATLERLEATGSIDYIPDSVEIEIIDELDSEVFTQAEVLDGSPIDDALAELGDIIDNESSELPGEVVEPVQLGDIMGDEPNELPGEPIESPQANVPESSDDLLNVQETPKPAVRQRTGEAGGSDVAPRVQRAAVRNEQERETPAAPSPEQAAESSEKPASAEAPATPAPRRKKRPTSTTQQAEEQPDGFPALDREITPRVGTYRVSRNATGEWQMDPLGSEADTSEFLDEQVGRLRRLASETLETRLRLNEEIESLISVDDGTRTDDADEDGSGDISAVELESLRIRLAESDRSLADIDAALSRIEEGTYGLSRGLPPRSIIQSAASSEPTLAFIPAERLEALPSVSHNINELSPDIPYGYVGTAVAATNDDGNDQDIPESGRSRRNRSRRGAETSQESEPSEPEEQRAPAPQADIGPLPGRRRTTRLDDPGELDRPIFVPDYSNYQLPYDPSKTYEAPTARNSSMLLNSLGVQEDLPLADRERMLADVVRAAFDEPEWSNAYALGRMFGIVDEATDLNSDEAMSVQAQETMERVQQMILAMYDNAIALAEVTEDSDTMKIDMSED
jgi:hypothetical protein